MGAYSVHYGSNSKIVVQRPNTLHLGRQVHQDSSLLCQCKSYIGDKLSSVVPSNPHAWVLVLHWPKVGGGRLHGETIRMNPIKAIGLSKLLGRCLHRDRRLLGTIPFHSCTRSF